MYLVRFILRIQLVNYITLILISAQHDRPSSSPDSSTPFSICHRPHLSSSVASDRDLASYYVETQRRKTGQPSCHSLSSEGGTWET